MTITAEAGDAGKRLDAFLRERLPDFSRSRLQSWIKTERVLVGGKVLRASYILRGGETVSVAPANLPPLRAEPEELGLKILYEDRTPRHFGGTFSIASEAPTPHSPPMPMPNSARKTRNAVKLGAKPQRTSTME